MLESEGAKSALIAVVNGGEPADAGSGRDVVDVVRSPAKLFALVQEYGAAAAQIVGRVLGTLTAALLGIFVFFYAVYVFLVDGVAYYEWLEKHAPIEVEHMKRLARAFDETGRGLVVALPVVNERSSKR